MLDLGQDIGSVEVEKTEGLDLAVAEIFQLNLEFALKFRKQALFEDQNLLFGGFGGVIGPLQDRPDAPVQGLC